MSVSNVNQTLRPSKPFSRELTPRLGPEQLRPFEGILKFGSDCKSFPGTLFRFPLPQSKKPPIKCKISASEARRHLESYLEEANISLLFLNKMTSISFWDKGSKEPNWSVRSKKILISDEPNISHVTIYDQSQRQPHDSEPSRSPPKDWCVFSGKMVDPPKSLVEIQRKERLERNYGLAALLSEVPTDSFFAKHFVGLPLQGSARLGIPVHVNAVSGIYLRFGGRFT